MKQNENEQACHSYTEERTCGWRPAGPAVLLENRPDSAQFTQTVATGCDPVVRTHGHFPCGNISPEDRT